MSNEIEKLKSAMEALPTDIQENVKNLIQLVAIQQEEIELLHSQVAGFMGINGPQPSELAKAFQKAEQNTFGKGDAVKTVSALKDELKKQDRWIEAALKSFKFAKEVVSILK